jgi:DNA-directed RNA polymerase specialized sigma24 family protein
MPTRVRRGVSASGTGDVTRGPMSDGDLEAFYRQIYLPLVRRATWKHRLLREDARDIVQDAFVLALTKLNGSGNPKAWLIQVVDHLSINYRRRAIRRSNLAERWGLGDLTGESLGKEADDFSDH